MGKTLNGYEPKAPEKPMLTNPHHIRHYPRQANVVVMVTDSKAEVLSMYHKLITLDVFIIASIILLEVREYSSSISAEPVNVTTYVNPAKWVMLAKADPEKIAGLP